MGTLKLYRHGDVMMKTREGFEIPNGISLSPLTLLYRGANHDHSVKSGKAMEGRSEDGKRYLRVVEDLTVDHPEHGQGTLPPQDYWVEIKSEYDHFAEESRQVID